MKERKIRVQRQKHVPAEGAGVRSVIREEVQLALQEAGLARTLDLMAAYSQDRDTLLGGIGVILWDIRTAVDIAHSSSGSSAATLRELIEQLRLSLSSLDELLDKDQYRHIMARGRDDEAEMAWLEGIGSDPLSDSIAADLVMGDDGDDGSDDDYGVGQVTTDYRVTRTRRRPI